MLICVKSCWANESIARDMTNGFGQKEAIGELGSTQLQWNGREASPTAEDHRMTQLRWDSETAIKLTLPKVFMRKGSDKSAGS